MKSNLILRDAGNYTPTDSCMKSNGKLRTKLTNMGGLGRVLKMYGKINVTDKNGNKVVWVWDYAENKARLETEMTKEQWSKSEKSKYQALINRQ